MSFSARDKAMVVVSISLLLATALSTAPSAETVLLKLRPLPLQEGLELEYATKQRHPRRDNFTSRVRIVNIEEGRHSEPSRVRFHWEITDKNRRGAQSEMGHITTTGIPQGRSYDPWWTDGEDIVTSHNHMWLSQAACRELAQRGETRFAISVTHRNDKEVALKVVGEVTFETRIDGHPASLAAVELKSARNDTLIVLNDCENPLVLQANIPGVHQWRLVNVRWRRPKRLSP